MEANSINYATVVRAVAENISERQEAAQDQVKPPTRIGIYFACDKTGKITDIASKALDWLGRLWAWVAGYTGYRKSLLNVAEGIQKMWRNCTQAGGIGKADRKATTIILKHLQRAMLSVKQARGAKAQKRFEKCEEIREKIRIVEAEIKDLDEKIKRENDVAYNLEKREQLLQDKRVLEGERQKLGKENGDYQKLTEIIREVENTEVLEIGEYDKACLNEKMQNLEAAERAVVVDPHNSSMSQAEQFDRLADEYRKKTAEYRKKKQTEINEEGWVAKILEEPLPDKSKSPVEISRVQRAIRSRLHSLEQEIASTRDQERDTLQQIYEFWASEQGTWVLRNGIVPIQDDGQMDLEQATQHVEIYFNEKTGVRESRQVIQEHGQRAILKKESPKKYQDRCEAERLQALQDGYQRMPNSSDSVAVEDDEQPHPASPQPASTQSGEYAQQYLTHEELAPRSILTQFYAPRPAPTQEAYQQRFGRLAPPQHIAPRSIGSSDDGDADSPVPSSPPSVTSSDSTSSDSTSSDSIVEESSQQRPKRPPASLSRRAAHASLVRAERAERVREREALAAAANKSGAQSSSGNLDEKMGMRFQRF